MQIIEFHFNKFYQKFWLLQLNFYFSIQIFYIFPEYKEKSQFFGCVVGRYGNRIARGKFTLDNKEYILAVNNGPNALHGGKIGFDKVFFVYHLVFDKTQNFNEPF